MPKCIRPLFWLVLGALLLALAPTGPARAQTISLIRDAEIENTIRVWATPLFEAAGLPAEDISTHLVNDSRLNAFVAGGMNLFINTGLLQRAGHAGQVIGVIAHETGHISGGHLARTREELEKATIQQILAMVLAGAAILATGEGGAGVGAAIGGMDAARRNFLNYSRTQESAADQAAFRLLDRLGYSARGLMEFLTILVDQELLSPRNQDPYLRSHPITRERVDIVREYLTKSRHADAPLPTEYAIMHARMVAKLDGFLNSPGSTLARYRADDRAVPARYARAVAYYRRPDLAQAVPAIDSLIAEFPRDPFFHELKGQMLFENGRASEAVAPYGEAARLLPGSALLRFELGRVLIELNDASRLAEAVGHLEAAVRVEPRNPSMWRQLGIAYGRDNQIGLASLALAESAIIRGERREAMLHVKRAHDNLKEGSPAWIRAEDIRRTAMKKPE